MFLKVSSAWYLSTLWNPYQLLIALELITSISEFKTLHASWFRGVFEEVLVKLDVLFVFITKTRFVENTSIFSKNHVENLFSFNEIFQVLFQNNNFLF